MKLEKIRTKLRVFRNLKTGGKDASGIMKKGEWEAINNDLKHQKKAILKRRSLK